MKFYNTIIKYRFWLSLLALVAAVGVTISSGFWPAFILYFVGVIGLASHFFIGPLRLIQEPMERGDMDEVERILDSVWYPNLLYKPVRSTYYTIKAKKPSKPESKRRKVKEAQEQVAAAQVASISKKDKIPLTERGFVRGILSFVTLPQHTATMCRKRSQKPSSCLS